MRKIAICSILFLMGLSAASMAEQETNMKILDRAYMDALKKHHKQAVAKIIPLLDSYSLNKADEIVLAHQILAYSYCEMENLPKATEHLKALRAFSPNEDFRVFELSPACSNLLGQSNKSAVPLPTKSKK